MFLEHQIIILESFSRDNMTLKTGVITAKKFSCPITEINYIQLAKIFNNIFLKSFFMVAFNVWKTAP